MSAPPAAASAAVPTGSPPAAAPPGTAKPGAPALFYRTCAPPPSQSHGSSPVPSRAAAHKVAFTGSRSKSDRRIASQLAAAQIHICGRRRHASCRRGTSGGGRRWFVARPNPATLLLRPSRPTIAPTSEVRLGLHGLSSSLQRRPRYPYGAMARYTFLQIRSSPTTFRTYRCLIWLFAC